MTKITLRKRVAHWLNQINEHDPKQRNHVWRIAQSNPATRAMIERETEDYAKHIEEWHR